MTTPYRQQGAHPQGAYDSPIPVRAAHLGDALASEWTKIRSVRSTVWTLGVMIVLMFGLGVLSAVAVSAAEPELGEESVLGLGFFGVLLGSICVITLGVMTIASEYGTGMIRTTLTACPSRARVLTAKATVFFLLVFVITTVTAAIVGALQTAIADTGVSTGEDWFRATVGAGLFVALLGLLSLAVGALIRHSAGAITVMIGLVLLPLVLALFMYAESLRPVQEFLLEYSIPSQLGVLYDTSVSDEGPNGWQPLWTMAGLAGAAMAGAYLSLDRRDV
ncbi:ABC transporter permease [Streptomyces spongiicola]|uniref:ABC transporter permease n=1 Tax=Streptomyces spongiicola TaxID=1690221 RepID=A0A2S1Z4K3_9ACTN|nr:ABC transporter permease [Streptomyces spongiicola]AWK10808.1 ABC transporter permease [Streptomyces spongiicola]GBQ01674.1 ABC transporter permease [Streptomyces spongiicola]